MSLDLDGWRGRIDALNTQLVDLLNERARCALAIAEHKKEKNLPVHDPKREKEVLEKVARHNSGPLTDEALQGIFRCIMTEHRKLEEET
jgi:chorismate mutase